MRLELPNGHSVTGLKVNPKDWQKKTASMKKEWCIWFRFYHADGRITPVQKSGMNHLKKLSERQAATKLLLKKYEQALLDGWNPADKEIVPHAKPEPTPEPIDEKLATPDTGLLKGLEIACEEKKERVGQQQYADLKSCINSLKNCPTVLKLTCGQTERKEAIKILNEIKVYKLEHGRKKEYTDNMFNKDLAHLRMLFKVLVKHQAVRNNPIDEYFDKVDIVVEQREY